MRLLICLLAAAILRAQPTTVTVTDTIYDQFGSPYYGSVTVSLQGTIVYSGGEPALYSVKSIAIKNGVLSLKVIPGSSYQFVFGTGVTLTCTFPASNTPVTLQANCGAGGSGASGHVTWSSLGHVTWASIGHTTWSSLQ